MSATAKTALGVFTAVTVAIAAIAIAENIYDKAHDNLDELSEKGEVISDNISNVKSGIDEIDEQIAELNKQKLNITDPNDITTLNTQIELLQQRKELLESKYANDKKEAENNANAKIEATKNNSIYSGAKYSDGHSGKFNKWNDFWNYAAGDAQLATYSVESYVDTLESRLNSIHPDELQNVVDNLNEIYETYDEIAQNDELVGTEAYETAIEKQKQINELLNKTQYLQTVRNNLDKEYVNNIDGNKITNAKDYETKLSSLIMKSYSNNGINIGDVNSVFGENVSKLEQELQNQGRTLEDYVVWINSAAASQIEFLNSINGTSSDTSFKSYSKTLREYKDVLSEIKEKNIDLSQTKFGNIDTNDRQLLEWNDLNLSKFKEELISWNEGIDWKETAQEFKNSISTVYGGANEYDGIQVAFSPILQTESGAELLSKDTVDKYISQIFENAGEDKSLDNILKLDSTGLNVDGKIIKGLIADIGDTAIETSEKMHYLGDSGALGLLKADLNKIIDSMPTIDLTVETEDFENLNSAIKETVGATGLTAESIKNLESRFGDLSQYDKSKFFENTANGVKVNREELEKLEKQQEQINKSQFDTKLEALKEKYKLLTTEMENCSDKNSVAYLGLVQQRNAVVDDINAVSELSAQYRGLTSEYQKWIDAQSNGEDGDMYDSIRDGLEKAKELFESGLVGTNEFRAYVDLLSGKDLSTASVDEVVSTYEELGKTIEGTSYKATDFLKEDSDGVENALKALSQLNSKWASVKDGEWNLNIPIEDAAQKLGISSEYLESILNKAADYGLTINYEDKDVDLSIEKIENLEEVTERAAKSLKENQFTDIDFDFNVKNIDSIEEQVVEIETIIDSLRDKDSKLNLDSDDVKNAELVLFSLLKRKAELEQPTVMNVDVSNPTSDIEKAVKKVQDFQSAIDELNTLNTLNEKGFNVDTTEAEGKVKQLADEIDGLPKNIKKNLSLDTEEAKTALNNLSNTDISTSIHINQDDLNIISTSIDSITPTMIVEAGVDATKVEDYQNSEHNSSGTVIFSVDEVQSNNNVYKWTPPTRKGKVIYEASGSDNLNGTVSGRHRLNGTINKSGTAKVSGDWGAKNTEISLIGEIAPEIWVHSDTGKWELVNYPQFRKVKKGDIIFNGLQTKELLGDGSTGAFGNAFTGGTAYSGKIIGDGKFPNKFSKSSNSSSDSTKSTSNNSNSDDKEPQTFDWIETKISRIERAIDRLKSKVEDTFSSWGKRNKALSKEINSVTKEINIQEKAASKYQKKANAVGLSSSWKKKVQDGSLNIDEVKSDSLKEKIQDYQNWYEKVLECKDSIQELKSTLNDLNQEKFDNWMTRFDNSLQDKVHKNELLESSISRRSAKASSSNTIDYSTKAAKANITDYQSIIANNDAIIAKRRTEIKKLKQIQKSTPKGTEAWYKQQEEINNIQNEINDLKEDSIDASNEIAQAYVTMFDNIGAKFDITLSDIEHRNNLLEEQINQIELSGHMVNESFYKAQSELNNQNQATLEAQLAQQQQALNEAVASGSVKVGSEDWKNMISEINETAEGIEGCKTKTIEFNKAIRDLHWELFDMFQEKVSDITSESDFLIDLLSKKDLFDDKGKFTDEGNAVFGLRVTNMETYARQAKEYANEITRLDAEYANDSLNTEYLNRRQKLIELQRDCIKNTEDEKDAIVDLVQDGIDAELNALQELIDKRKDALRAQKDLYDYQKNVKNQAKEIASLEKQLSAYSGDISEETKAKIQQIKVSLEEAKEDLRETEYDKYISDQEKLLDDLYDEYEEVLNSRLDDVSALIQGVIDTSNANADKIANTINGLAGVNGYTLQSIGEILGSAQNGNILTAVNNVITAINSLTTALTNTNGTTPDITGSGGYAGSSEGGYPQNAENSTQQSTSTQGNGQIDIGDTVEFVNNKGKRHYYTDSKGNGRKEITDKNSSSFIITRINKGADYPYLLENKNGVKLGWVNSSQIKGYASGIKNLSNDEIAWTQENGAEAIIRKSDGALLTPLGKGDTVFNSIATENLWKLANNPYDYLNDSFAKMVSRINTNSVANRSFEGNIENNITITLPNVQNYDDFKRELQRDKSFEKMIQSMTVDRITGGTVFGKYKY